MKPTEAIRAIAAANQLEIEHTPAVLAEAAALAESPGIDDPALVDRTGLCFVTIDEESSKDLDQALFIEGIERGWRVWYAIADAAHFVRPGTALFEEGLRRGSSFYLPGLVLPMLPAVLSEGVVSLNPDEDRRALLFVVDLDPAGRVVQTRIERARVRSRCKTWYDAVQDWFDGRQLCPGGADVAACLRALRSVGDLRMALAEARDVVQFRRAELRVELAEGEASFVGSADLRNDVERWNEQISLLCNVEGAKVLLEPDPEVQPIFRTHEPPAPERLDQLEEMVRTLVRVHGLDPELWRWNRGSQSLAAWLRGLPVGSREGRVGRALHRQALLSTGRAAFTGEPGRHFGVGADIYARFTAPMREMVGVFTHKECWEKLGEAPNDRVDDEAIRDRIIAGSSQTRQLQRKLDEAANLLVLDGLFSRDVALEKADRPRRRGTVMGVSRNKVHVQLDEPPIDVKVYMPHLAEQRGCELFAGKDGATVREKRTGDTVLRVGDGVELVVAGHDSELDRWQFLCEIWAPVAAPDE